MKIYYSNVKTMRIDGKEIYPVPPMRMKSDAKL
jgi:hypothetical protein